MGKYTNPLPAEWDGDVFTLREWNEYVKVGFLMPDDGTGYQANELGYDNTLDAFGPKAEDCTHIVWYNK